MTNYEEWRSRIALRCLPGVGDIVYKNLIANCESAREVLNDNAALLSKVPGAGKTAFNRSQLKESLLRADREIAFMEKNKVTPWFYLDAAYPKRLKWCDDAPVILYTQGNFKFDGRPLLAMVGTRNATSYGLEFCEDFIRDLVPYSPVIVSGLAYGIDIKCHREAMKMGLSTLALVGHGLDRLYPSLHTRDANRMKEQGAIISEFMSGVKPDRENFPKRNRIVAGMCDAVLVVEANIKGGALITAKIANSYNREVFAVPGRLGDAFSSGCNHLIKSNKASMITGVKDLEYMLNWEKLESRTSVQRELPLDLSAEEELVLKELNSAGGTLELSELSHHCEIGISKALQILLKLELKGLIISNPGKIYKLCRM